ncbi:MAG: SpoIIE family protein phosphatase [Solirubrobacteraceae bacterium]
MNDTPAGDEARGRRRRSDAEKNIDRIEQAAAELLLAEPEAGLEEIAAAAGVSRSTIYRHFGSREELVGVVAQRARETSDSNQSDALRPPGELAGGPTPLDVADVLNKVPPHLLGDQIVAEAQRLTGVTSVALYLIDIDGTLLLRLAGSDEFPTELEAPLAVGPEIPREGLPGLRAMIARELPGSVMAPLLLRGRALGVLLAVDAPEQPLVQLGRQAGAALALANVYTDVFDTTRRRKETSPASEIQQNLLPPRIARISGGIIAGNVLPGYEIGGDWFDYVENSDGAWIGVADSMGNGTTAAALGGVSLGAFRAKRRVNAQLDATALAIHHTMLEVAVEGAFVNVILGRWHGPSSTFRSITCGRQAPLLITTDGELTEMHYTEHPALGLGDSARRFTVDRLRLAPGERLLLLSDGVLERRTLEGAPFGLEGVRTAIASAVDGAAASTVRAVEDAITAASDDPLEDDATIVVFAPTSPQ